MLFLQSIFIFFSIYGGSVGAFITDSTSFTAQSMLAKFTNSSAFATTNATLTGAGAITCLSVNTTSDKNMKTEIEPLARDYQTQFINRLKPVQYKFKEDPNKKRFGFLAQDVEQIINENLAIVESSTSIKSLNYQELFAPIVSVLQNILQRLDDLENKVLNKTTYK